ncbi:MAG: anaerobic ribonucleoside-triphosphate reductase [Peptostreptococcaceae bacterium]
MNIRKRDGRIKPYDTTRIENAISKAIVDVFNEDNREFAKAITKQVHFEIMNTNLEVLDIEDVQDIVIKTIMRNNRRVANAYSSYREKRTDERQKRSYIGKEICAIANHTSEEITNNANKDGRKIQSLRAMYADVVCKDYNKREVVPKHLLAKHEKELYIHDLNYFGQPFYNCCLINWEDMLKNGFRVGTTHICSINSFTTAIALMAQIVSHVASNCYGGVTLPKAVSGLVPYAKISLNKHRKTAKKWKIEDVEGYAFSLLEKELQDGAQSFEYEIQTLTTARAEVPFVTLGLDIGIIDGDDEDVKLSRMITKAFLNQRINGLTGGITPVFPKITYQMKDGVNLNQSDPNYDLFQLATKCSALRGYPDYINTKQCEKVTGGYKEPMGKLLLPI